MALKSTALSLGISVGFLALTLTTVSVVLATDLSFPPISETDLRQLVPEVRRPRHLTTSDLADQDQRSAFKDYGMSFWLTGDFDGDKRTDLVLVGRFDNRKNPEDQTFLIILTRHNTRWERVFFLRPKARIIALKTTPHPDPARAQRGDQGIVANFTVVGSDDYALVYWNGSRYVAESGFDIVRREIERLPHSTLPTQQK